MKVKFLCNKMFNQFNLRKLKVKVKVILNLKKKLMKHKVTINHSIQLQLMKVCLRLRSFQDLDKNLLNQPKFLGIQFKVYQVEIKHLANLRLRLS